MRPPIIPTILRTVRKADWWCGDDRSIAAKYNFSHTTVNRARKLTGIPSPSKRIYNFANVDWSKNDTTIMKQLKCCKEVVARERKRVGIMPSHRGGRRGETKWTGIDWSMDVCDLAQIHGTTKQYMGYLRRRTLKLANKPKL
jgi:hypothetical protein